MKFYHHLILVFVFVSSVLSAAHVHDHNDAHSSENCQICILEYDLSSADIPQTIVLDKVDICIEVFTYSTSTFSYTLHKSFNSHAPPSFS